MATRTGKIARLPLRIREELNQRLRDNQSGQEILPWVNGLQETKEILDRHFYGNAISDANLSEWRSGGFAEWLDDQTQVHKIERLSELSFRIAKAAGGDLSEGLLAIAAGKLQEALEAGTEMTVDDEGEPVMTGPALDKLVKAITDIRGMELDKQKLTLKREEVSQKGQALALETKKFQRTTAELFIKWVADEEAKNIATSDMSNDNKLEALGQHLFGDAW